MIHTLNLNRSRVEEVAVPVVNPSSPCCSPSPMLASHYGVGIVCPGTLSPLPCIHKLSRLAKKHTHTAPPPPLPTHHQLTTQPLCRNIQTTLSRIENFNSIPAMVKRLQEGTNDEGLIGHLLAGSALISFAVRIFVALAPRSNIHSKL